MSNGLALCKNMPGNIVLRSHYELQRSRMAPKHPKMAVLWCSVVPMKSAPKGFPDNLHFGH
jgi:hypothetical protein